MIRKLLGREDKGLKQVILVRSDLKLPKGKLAAQVAHASVSAALKGNRRLVDAWAKEGMKKIVLKVKDEKELDSYASQAREEGLITAIITDAGKTVVAPGTVTCCGIGPDAEGKIDKVTQELKMV